MATEPVRCDPLPSAIIPSMDTLTSLPRNRPDWATGKRPSKITVPKHAHPFAKLLFAEMRRQNVSYAELEWRSGVQTSTFKSYRTDNTPGMTTIEAALGAVGWTLVPVPKPETLPSHLREQLDELGQHFRSDAEALGAAITAAATWPLYASERLPTTIKLARTHILANAA